MWKNRELWKIKKKCHQSTTLKGKAWLSNSFIRLISASGNSFWQAFGSQSTAWWHVSRFPFRRISKQRFIALHRCLQTYRCRNHDERNNKISCKLIYEYLSFFFWSFTRLHVPLIKSPIKSKTCHTITNSISCVSFYLKADGSGGFHMTP